MKLNAKRIEEIQRYGKTVKGKTELIQHLEGEPLSRKQAIAAHCYECMGYFCDGRQDCRIPQCSLYTFMVFSSSKKNKASKVLSEAHKAKLQAGRKKAFGV